MSEDVRELHLESDLDGFGNKIKPYCIKCKVSYPCLTIQVQRVRELHKPVDLTYGEEQVCEVCYDEFGSSGSNLTYPCPTIKALEGETNE